MPKLKQKQKLKQNLDHYRKTLIHTGLLLLLPLLLLHLFVNTAWSAIEANNWIFNNPANYTYDSAKIEVTGGEAVLKSTSSQITDDTQAEFDQGTYTNSRYKTDHIELKLNETQPTANTLALYHLNETSGTVTDSSGNGNNANNNGATQGVTGKFENAIQFDGANDYLEIPNDLGDPDAMTIEFWFNKANINGGSEYFLDGQMTGNWWFTQDHTTPSCADTEGNICFNGLVEIPSSYLSNNTWYHVALTENTTETKIYLDGSLINTGPGFNPKLGTNVRIGTSSTGSGYLEGKMDEVVIWDSVLDAPTIAEHAEGGYKANGEYLSDIYDAVNDVSWDQIEWTENLQTVSNWLNSSWAKRKKITVDNTGNATPLTNHQIEIDVAYDAEMNADFSDLRFTSSDGTTEIDYWIHEYTASTNATIWVEVPSISASSTEDIYIYYGNSSASTTSNGENTFLFFDDFDDGTINTSKWTETDVVENEIIETDGKLAFTRTSNGSWNKAIISNTTFSRSDLSFEFDYQWTVNNPEYDAIMFGWHDSGTATAYSSLVYAYYNPGSGGASTVGPSVYEDGASRSGITGSWSVTTDYDVRVRMRNSGGAYYEQSTDSGENWTTSYTSTYSTESDLKPAWSFFSGTHRFDNARVRNWTSPEPTISFASEQGRVPTDLKFQVQSCNDDACAGESFVGPDGTGATYFTTPTGESLNVDSNRYFQYKAFLSTTDEDYTSETSSVTIDRTSYPLDAQTIRPTSSLEPTQVAEWKTFIETATKPAGTAIYYQLSDDDGTIWQYWDGSAWVTAGASDYNESGTVNTNIPTFPVANGKILFKAFLISSGGTTPRLNNIEVDYQGDINTVNCVKDWEFTTSGNYTFNISDLEVSSDNAHLLASGTNFTDDDQTDFDNGSYSQTEFSTDHVRLSAGQVSGTYESSIKDATTSTDWPTLSWIPKKPYGKELPDNGQSETAYSAGNISMTGNLLLMHMNETSGAITDSSGNSNNGTNNGAISATGKLGNALYFGGDGDVVESNSYTYSFTDELTIASWFKYNGAGTGSPRILEISTTGGTDSHALAPDADGSLRAWVDCEGGNSRVASVDDATNYNDGDWHYMVYTYENPNGRLYVDGVETVTASGACTDLDDGAYLVLGAVSDGNGAYAHADHAFDGWLDEVAVWNRALGPSEVSDIYNRGANNIRYQVQSCNDVACSGESYIGPDGTGSTYYSELSNSSTALPSFTMTNVLTNRYFQHKAYFDTDDVSFSPELSSVSVTASGTNYPTDYPILTPSASFSQSYLTQLTNFEETSTKGPNAEIYYQLSNDDGSSFKWWNGSQWDDIDNGIPSDSNTLVFWRFNETSGDVIDSSSNTNNGADNGTTRGVAGQRGNAFSFDGVDDYIDVPFDPSLNLISTDFTIDFWIKTTDTNSAIIKKYTGTAGGDAWALRLASGVVEFYDGSSWISSGIDVSSGNWTHFAMTADDSSDTLEFFENGVSQGTESFGNITSNIQNIFIATDSNSFFNGSLDDFRISDKVRTQGEFRDTIYLFNTATEIASNISSYSITTENILFKAFFESDGADQASLDNLRLSCTYSTNDQPVATLPTTFTQATNGGGIVTFETQVSDANNNDTKLKVEYSDDGGSNWYDAEISSVTVGSGNADLDNAEIYQIGSVDNIDTSGGAVTVGVNWDTQSSSNGNGSLANQQLDSVQIRVTPNDFISNGATQTSASFSVDNLSPAGLTGLSVSSVTTTTMAFSFTAVTSEINFDHYEIWYGTNSAEVENRTGSAQEWDNGNDSTLSTMSTSSTTITGLNNGTTYYAKIFAVDNYGNEMTTATTSGTTNSPIVGGGGSGGGSSSSSQETTADDETGEDGTSSVESSAGLEYYPDRSREFVDLDEEHWAYQFLEFLKKIRITDTDEYVLSGYTLEHPTGELAEVGANENVKRYELIKMVLVANNIKIKEDLSGSTEVFSDVEREFDEDEGGNTMKRIVYSALDAGVISGDANKNANPYDNVNRAEAMKIILNAAGIDVSDIGEMEGIFVDISENAWFYEYVYFAYNKGIVGGYSSEPGFFHPERTMTRAQAAKVITLTMPLSVNIDEEMIEKVIELFEDDIPY